MMKTALFSILAAGAAVAAVPATPQSPLGGVSPSPGSYRGGLNKVISESALLSFHRDIVEIASVTGDEHDVGEFIVRFLQEKNFTVTKQTVTPETASQKERFNIYAYPEDQPHPEILLTSHIDTVPPFIPYSLEGADDDGDDSFNRESIAISGRGSVDAKGSVAAQIFAALDTLAEPSSAPALGLLFVVGEETGGDGMKRFSDSPLNTSPPSYHTVIFGEPTELALVSGHKGMLGFDILAHGRAAHSGYPWLGRSAVSAILPVLSRVDQLGDIPAEEGGLPASPKYGKTTVNLGTVNAGVAANVVPATAQANVAVRLAAGTPEEAREIVRQAVRDALTHDDDNVSVDFSHHSEAYPPQDLDTDVDGFQVITVNYGTDVPNLVIHDSPAARVKRYLYGPGSIHVAHGDHEALTVGALEEAVRGYKRLIQAANKN
ncbi:hypothetical protein ASPZODRAFT_141058 [Penicilliopsis zonata CBS 506.65]|uniref:Peptidase M20 dimerisation domain-containing protein n=1 Tax=Penicilliopsis zonata CBS 506.65 TaxID=1073090 RepID=A0A1L9SK48_9EURO|nr:hypothetical protein ASPZODRAFT_141058 [Penicilliopsis zonata CBS 506.65]OJJ47466.1 hypothetical protein ASPZODRAFT_141058 [Penicilliopsis zonata CBS 506.65]